MCGVFGRYISFCLVAGMCGYPYDVQAQQTYGESDAPLVAEVLGMEIRTHDPDEMAHVIKQRLMGHYAQEHSITVDSDEVKIYLFELQQAKIADRKEREARRARLQQELKLEALSELERTRLESELHTLNSLHGYDLEADAQKKEATSEEVEQAKAEVARAFIRQWKINRSLYRQYGGRVIFQQGGAEPVDAYHDFLRVQEQKGAFKILDKQLQPSFWEYYVTDSKHSFYPAEEESERAINVPWWLTRD